MPDPINIEALISQLRQLRLDKGDEAFMAAIQSVAEQILVSPQGEGLLKAAMPDIDLDKLKASVVAEKQSVVSGSPDEAMMKMLAMQVPNMKTQAQFNAFMGCFDALRATLNAYFGDQKAAAEMGREALNQALDMAKQIATMSEKLNEIPDEVKSDEAKEFTRPAKELHEYDTCKRLLGELTGLQTTEALQKWYSESRQTIDEVMSAKPRNELMDAIRAKRNELMAKDAN